jgi:predicted kinase
LIVVSGPAGSGKTTLAHRLATEVGCPAVCRDEIKEGMVVTAGPGFVAATSDPLTMRTYGVFFATLELLVRAGVTLVAEAAFQHRRWVQGLEPILTLVDLRVVRCGVDPAVARIRMLRRQRDQATRAAHADAEHLAGAPAFDPIHLDVPTLDVDTTDGYVPGLVTIVTFATQT